MDKEIIKNLKITDTAYGGAGVGRSDDGRVIFVPKTVEGDIVDVKIYEEKATFANAFLLNIASPSPYRIKPQCSYANKCGGCPYGHIEYNAQQNIKIRILKNQLRKYSHILPKIKYITSSNKGYRLRATARSLNGKIGFYAQNTRDLIEVENCPVIKESLFEKMKNFAKDNSLTGEIYAIENKEDIALAHIISQHININNTSYFEGMFIDNKKYGITSINFNTLYGAVPVTYKSFFQANRYLLDDFQKYAISLVSDYMDIVELYAGAGFFTCALMEKGKVQACEADQISSNLGRQLGYNIKTMDSGKFLSQVKKCDSIFLDPPRDGADKKVIENIKRLKPYEIIYVSCNPNTLARDIIRLQEEYKAEEITLFDMYPDTYHIESVVRLVRV